MPRPRRRRASRLLVALVALLVLEVVAVPVASGGTIKRTWNASVGTSGTNGTSRIYGYTNGTGFLLSSLKGLGASRTWSVAIHGGTCASLGTKLLGFGSVRTLSNGTATVNHVLDSTQMGLVWKATWNAGTVSLRLVSGSTVKCAPYRFPTATRVVVASQGIDLPVIRGPKSALYCNVAMYTRELSQPGEVGVSMIYAHARTGMFLPLLNASRINNGAALIGKTVKVYMSNSKYYTYQITEVRRRQTSIQSAFGVLEAKVLWLQTSEGPYATSTKLVVVARQTGGPFTATYTASHPRPRPISC